MDKYIFLIAVLLVTSFSLAAQNGDEEYDLQPISLENVDDLARLERFDLPSIKAFDWTTDSTQLLIVTYGGIWLLEIDGMQLNRIPFDEVPYKASFIENMNQILIESESGWFIYDLATSEITPTSPHNNVFSSDGRFYATLRRERDANGDITAMFIQVFETDQDSLLYEIPVTLADDICVYICGVGLEFSPDSIQLAYYSSVIDVESGFIDLASGDKMRLPQVDGYFVVKYSPRGELIAAVQYTPGFVPEALILIDTETAEILVDLEFYTSATPDFTSSGELIAIGAYDTDPPERFDEALGFLYLIDVQQAIQNDDFNPVRAIQFIRPPEALAFSPDDRMISVSSGNGQLNLWGVAIER